MGVNAYARASVLIAIAVGLLAAPALSGDLPADVPGALCSYAAFASPSDTQFGFDSIGALGPSSSIRATTAGGLAGSAGASSGRKDWVSTAAIAVTVVGAAAGFSQALLGNSAKAATASAEDPTKRWYQQELPVPEPSSLILASLAISAAIVHLRRRLAT